jgi:predicted ATPase
LPAERKLVGRSSELSELTTALEEVADGAGSSFLVEGEAGIGKTSLVDEALDTTRRLGLQVYRATAEELERRRPFGATAWALTGVPGIPGGRRSLGSFRRFHRGLAGSRWRPPRIESSGAWRRS